METAVAEKKETGTTGEGTPAGTTMTTGTANIESQTQASTSPEEDKLKASGNKSDKIIFAHIALMEANGLKSEKLSTELRMKINAWAMGVRKYEKNQTPKLMEMNKKGSIAIADAIQDYIEKDLPDKSEEEMNAEKENQERMRMKRHREESERSRQREELGRKERELKARRDTQEKVVSSQKSKEQKIMSILSEKERIHYKELVEILGQDVGESVQVGSIKLLNVYLTNNYKQVQ
jgi:hypothetical protein